MKIEQGNKVMCVNRNGCINLTLNREYVVISVNSAWQVRIINDAGLQCDYHHSHFKKVEKVMVSFEGKDLFIYLDRAKELGLVEECRKNIESIKSGDRFYKDKSGGQSANKILDCDFLVVENSCNFNSYTLVALHSGSMYNRTGFTDVAPIVIIDLLNEENYNWLDNVSRMLKCK